MRAVLHDFPDYKCCEILNNITPAMGNDSVIIIDDIRLPHKNVHWHVTEIDLFMMTALASIERTQSQWSALLDSVGLKINKVFTYTPSIYGVIR
jgi:demethylsterigmatocystin 6-O-methyltransferase